MNACLDLDWPIALGIFLLWPYLSVQRSCFSRRILAGMWRATRWAWNPGNRGRGLWWPAGALLACIRDTWEVPNEFWLTQAQWHEEAWETRNFLDSFSLPHPFFTTKMDYSSDLLPTQIVTVCWIFVQEFLWSSLPYKKTFCMFNIYMSQYNITLWNPFSSGFEN